MKDLLFLAVFFFSIPLFSQEIAMNQNSSEPMMLYQKAQKYLVDGDIKTTINIYKEVIQFYVQQGREKELPQTYFGMALAFALNENYTESIRYHKKALKAHRKYRPNEPADEILTNLGLAYQLAGKERKAKKYLETNPG